MPRRGAVGKQEAFATGIRGTAETLALLALLLDTGQQQSLQRGGPWQMLVAQRPFHSLG